MSKHVFQYTHPDGDEVLHITTNVVCSDVVRAMYYYLLGCSFSQESIIEAMESIVSEYEDKNDVE